MRTLLIRLAGPMQAWGTQSRFSIRDTGLEPSKSGVIGLLCAALGKPRDESDPGPWPSLAQLASLRMGVRVDREGSMKADFHTAGGTHRKGEVYGVYRASGGISPDAVPSTRYYLANADFLVGLEAGDSGLLVSLDRALSEPKWQLYLGRKSFVPSVPIRLPDSPPFGPSVREQALEEALRSYPWFLMTGSGDEPPDKLRLVIETDTQAAEVRRDVPVCFATRRFALRMVKTEFIGRNELLVEDVSL